MKLAIGDLLSRSWRLCWRHRLLWVLGALVALPGSCSLGFQLPRGADGDAPARGLPDFAWPDASAGAAWQGLPSGLRHYLSCLLAELQALTPPERWAAPGPGLGAALGLLLLAGAFAVLAWLGLWALALVARTALIRGVAEQGDRLGSLGLRKALGLGWSMRTLRLLLADFLVGLGTLALMLPAAFVMIAVAVGLQTGARQAGESAPPLASGILVAVVLVGGVLLVMVLAALLTVFGQLYARSIAVDDAPIGAAFGAAIDLLRRHPGDLFRLGLALLFLAAGTVVASLPLLGLSVLALAALGVGLGAVFKLLLGSLLGGYPTLASLSMGLGLTGLLFGLIYLLLLGLLQAFYTAVWTLAWQALRAMDEPRPAEQAPPPLPADLPAELPA